LPTFIESNQVDGRVSIEVDPRLAYNTEETIAQGKHLYSIVNRPNLLIKVPATLDGLPAIEELTAQGISINVTLIFSTPRYEAVMDAYLRGIERRVANGLSVSDIHSVASFFVSRIDADIDKKLDSISANHPLRGKAAIANAVLAYEAYLKVVNSPRWTKLAALGANMQRPLWASTGVKDKNYDSTRYVVELVAKNCVNTMPEGTLNEVRSHGVVRGDTVVPAISTSHQIFKDLAAAGIDFTAVVNFLEDDGVAKFEKAWEELLANVEAVKE
jgi:transaldolase